MKHLIFIIGVLLFSVGIGVLTAPGWAIFSAGCWAIAAAVAWYLLG